MLQWSALKGENRTRFGALVFQPGLVAGWSHELGVTLVKPPAPTIFRSREVGGSFDRLLLWRRRKVLHTHVALPCDQAQLDAWQYLSEFPCLPLPVRALAGSDFRDTFLA